MREAPTPVAWSREMWETAGKASDYRLARLCPLCPNECGTRFTVQGCQSFTVPINWNADGFTIAVPIDGSESTVTWSPCGHAVVVEGRLDEPVARP